MQQRRTWILFTLILVVAVTAATPSLHAQTRQDEPFVVTSTLNAATPFTIQVPKTNANGRAINTVAIEFVSADCLNPAGVTFVGATKLSVLYKGGFAYYALPMDAPLSFTNGVEFVSAQKTLIFADPGSIISYGFSAGNPTCTVTFTGHLIAQ